MNAMSKRLFGIGAAAVMLASGAALPASAEVVSPALATTAELYQTEGLAKPKIVKTVKGQAAVKLTWNKVAKATGYKVFIKTASGWKCKAVIKSGSTLSTKIKGLNSKTKYQFKVQAYKKSKGKTYYSKYSTAVTVETKYGLGTNNFTSKNYDIRFSSKKWEAGLLGDAANGIFVMSYKGDDNIPADSAGLMIMAVERPEETKDKTLEEYIDEALKEVPSDVKVELLGYQTIDGYKFAVVDEQEDDASSIEFIGFTDKNMYAVIAPYVSDYKDASLKLVKSALKKMDIKK